MAIIEAFRPDHCDAVSMTVKQMVLRLSLAWDTAAE